MQKFFGIKVNTASMTLEELEWARNEAREMLSNLEHQIVLRKIAAHKYKSSEK